MQFENVSFRYESRKTQESVRALDFTVNDGEFILICGSSGSGKSTVGRLINGLAPYFYKGELSGNVMLDGRSVREIPQAELAARIGSVFQNPRTQFFDTDSTGEMAFGCENMGYPPEEIGRRIKQTSAEFGIEELLDKKLFGMSGGEKQKIACGSIYAVDPDVYIFDEPSSNLDLTSIRELARIMKLLKNRGKTVILIEHRIYYAMELTDRIFYMESGTVKEIYSRPDFVKKPLSELHQMGLRTSSEELSQLLADRVGIRSDRGYVDVQQLSFSYRTTAAHQNKTLAIQDLRIPKGSIIALIGENGAGKSTFVKCMCGLEKCEKAVIADNGRKLSARQRLRDSYLVMQDVNHQLFSESVEGELLLSDPDISKEQIESILEMLDLGAFLQDHPMALSGGQKQRVAVASACAAHKKYLYLDEPTSGLDYKQMKNMSRMIRSIKENVSFVMIVTHDPEFIFECCDHIIELEKGSVKSTYPLDKNGQMKLCEHFMSRVIDGGRIVQQGKHNELMQKDGIYRTFVNDRKKAVSRKL
ncbi:MAG: ABC transporter ATP-binding protein [Ruminococcus sp.]|nr:ABC transporter ATP-binding protein [Ruminococcus sp.]